VLIMRSSDADSVQVSMPEFHLSSRALVPATPAVAGLSQGRHRVHPRHPMAYGSWRGKGEVCPQSSVMAAVAQGGRIAGYGAYDVTDTKFSIRLGPPSCSPPV
jgi:hypothetical protein